jgi:3-oxoacyl-(acyl-carrier-protein) synthase
VANDAREHALRVAVSTSLGFGGNDSAVVFRALDS